MFKQDFINNFSLLGERISNWVENNSFEPILESAVASSFSNNPFFTPFMQRSSLGVIAKTFLQKSELERWLKSTAVNNNRLSSVENNVGVIMAGNIPAVGFHDFLSVLATGCGIIVKLSSKDKYLIPALASILCEINPFWEDRVVFLPDINSFYNAQNNLSGSKRMKCIIATGSNNTVQSIANVCKGLPILTRGRRFSFAVISGNESEQELELLAKDVFLYFGLGCRSVNFFLVPKGYSFNKMVKAFGSMQKVVAYECYINCCKRARAISIMEGIKFIDGNFFLLKESAGVYPPMAELNYLEYESEQDIINFVKENENQIQKKYCTFGIAQAPKIDEYADGIDTIEFILNATR